MVWFNASVLLTHMRADKIEMYAIKISYVKYAHSPNFNNTDRCVRLITVGANQ